MPISCAIVSPHCASGRIASPIQRGITCIAPGHGSRPRRGAGPWIADEAYGTSPWHGVRDQRRCIDQSRLQHARWLSGRGIGHEGQAIGPMGQFRRRSLGQHPALAHHVHPGTAFGLVHVGRVDHHAQPFTPHQLQQDLPQVTTRQRVHPHAGLVQQQQGRRTHQRAGQAQLLLHPARELAGRTRREAVHVHHLQQTGKAFVPLGLWHAMQVRMEIEVLLHAEVLVQAETLGHVADLVLHPLRVPRHVHAQHLQLAGIGNHQPGHHAHQCGLAGTIGTDQRRHLAAPHAQRHGIQRLYRLPIRPGESLAHAGGHHAVFQRFGIDGARHGCRRTVTGWPSRR